jgi:hypothetical protein
MLFQPNENDSDYSDIEQGQDNDIKQNEKPSLGQELCVIPLASGLTAALNSAGAAFLAKASLAGYQGQVAAAAGIGGFGTGILCTLILVGGRIRAAMCGESKSSESKCVRDTKYFQKMFYPAVGTLLGWGVLKLGNLTSMGVDQVFCSNLVGTGVVGVGLVVVTGFGGLALFCCKGKKPKKSEVVVILPSSVHPSLN